MPAIKVLVLHNRYQQKGGEDEVFAREVSLLRRKGHEVVEYVDTNDRLHQISPWTGLANAIWSTGTVDRLQEILHRDRPDVAHFHNTFAMISPSAFYACRDANVPVVQTLHNYRMGCANAYCHTDGKPCETCVSKTVAWPGVLRKCYRGSRLATAGAAAVTATHKMLGTYQRMVDAYISTTAFARQVHIRSGLPANRIFVKPNFSNAPAAAEKGRGGYALYAGRISADKGVDTLLSAWETLGTKLPLRLAGNAEGPMLDAVRRASARNPAISWLGPKPVSEIMDLMRGAAFLVNPSPLYEGCAMVVVEAFSAGLPCLVSGQGSLGELVEDGRTGVHFRTGEPGSLAAKVQWMWENPERLAEMGRAARDRFEEYFTPERNYEMLMEIYRAAVEHRSQ